MRPRMSGYWTTTALVSGPIFPISRSVSGSAVGYPAVMTATRTAPATPPTSRPTTNLRPFAGLSALTTLAILVQAFTAGQFVQQEGKDSWVTVHGVIADASWVLALITAAYAFFRLRAARPDLVRWSAVLFAVTLAQTGIGHLITDEGQDGWIAVHVPLAVLIFALTGWLTLRAVRAAR